MRSTGKAIGASDFGGAISETLSQVGLFLLLLDTCSPTVHNSTPSFLVWRGMRVTDKDGIGSPTEDRTEAGVAGSISFFTSYLSPARTRLSTRQIFCTGSDSFTDR